MQKWTYALAAAWLFAAGAAVANADETPEYDGSGSRALASSLISTPQNAVAAEKDKAKQARAKAQTAATRQSMERDAAAGGTVAMANLATLIEQDFKAGPADRARALDLYEKAGDSGNMVGRQKMCVAYLLGEGRTSNYAKAMGFCTPLGIKDPVGLFAGAFDYDKGITGPADIDMAANLYVEAVKLGSGDAADQLGQKAMAMSKPDIARKWYIQGVFLGSADAMDHLAQLSESGQGGVKDGKEAYWLYVNAARRGNAHARQWMAALPADTAPLSRLCLIGEKTVISRTYTDKKGKPHTEAYDATSLSETLGKFYPAGALLGEVPGYTEIHCYVDGQHNVDVCILQKEYPLNRGFGRISSAIFNFQLHATDTDALGNPTANTVLVLGMNWQLN
jgi:TPR repeat protein